MRYSTIPSVEDLFRQTGNRGEYSFGPVDVLVPGDNVRLKGLFCTPKNRSGYFYETQHPKEQIVLHFTAGNLSGDMSALTRQDYHVSVPFVIARDGTIYQLFSSKLWSGHIGKGIGNEGNARDKRTIGIELSNYGPLTEVQGNLETCYSRLPDPKTGKTGPVDIYCSLSEKEAYQRLATPFRGSTYFASYTEAQYDSLILLLRYLTAQFDIPRTFLPESKRYVTAPDVVSFRGIVSHVNYRPTGKWDIGPAFDWNRVIRGVQATRPQPLAAARSLTLNGERPTDLMTGISRSAAASGLPAEDFFSALSAARCALNEEEQSDYDDTVPPELMLAGDPDVAATPARTPRLYALIVGIDRYRGDIVLENQVRFPALYGCVNDATKVHRYLGQEAGIEPHLRLLTNEEATKAEVVRQFREHLGQAGPDDVALFYFSGHGTQEAADPGVWTTETDGKLECIACHYDRQTADEFLLSDKELRYLVHEVARNQPHLVTIFDCCHSGDNTRNGALTASVFDAKARQVPFVFARRPWEQFIFSDVLSPDEVRRDGLPEGTHLQFSASESDESAVEVAGEGVFTKALLTVLETTGGQVTYFELQSRVRNYLKNIFEQKPRLYVGNGDERLLSRTFLNKTPQGDAAALAEVVYNRHPDRPTGHWQLNLGALHGLRPGTAVGIQPGATGAPPVLATVEAVAVDTARLRLDDPDAGRLDPEQAYKVRVAGLMQTPVRVAVENEGGLPEDQQRLLDKLLGSPRFVTLTDEEDRAQYVVHDRGGQYYLSRPNDPFRPLAQPIDAGQPGAVDTVVADLQHLAQWEYLKTLQNRDAASRLPDTPIRVEFFTTDADGTERPLAVQDTTVPVLYHREDGRWVSTLKVRLTNPTPTRLYCAALYLSSSFGSFTGFLNPTVYTLEPGNSVYLSVGGNPLIRVRQPAFMKTYNWPKLEEYLNLLVSTETFDARALSLDELPEPDSPGKLRSGQRGAFDVEEPAATAPLLGWTVQSYRFDLINPEFNLVEEGALQTMLQNPNLADFALGLYFDGQLDETLRTVHAPKPQLVIRDTGGQLKPRGFFTDTAIDLANAWARHRRNRLYRRTIERFPDRVRIVSEGDSWFQHPLVTDPIDYLSKAYAVYCVAAAGDTLRNYARDGEFLEAVEEQKPAFFLISGGGNDILGSQFREYLRDNPDHSLPEGDLPRRFLKDTLFQELDTLRDLYRTLFANLRASHPDLHILVHGYDYPVKLNEAGKGWLGRYMIAKGIDRPGDRRALIRLILDLFNDNLKAVAREFPQVSYLDLRNLIRYDPDNGLDQWYDEIHPDDKGFQQVAMRFMQRIDELRDRGKKPVGSAQPGPEAVTLIDPKALTPEQPPVIVVPTPEANPASERRPD